MIIHLKCDCDDIKLTILGKKGWRERLGRKTGKKGWKGRLEKRPERKAGKKG